MCGIAGQFCYRGGQVDRELLLRVRDSMSARGPDGAGLWVNGERTALAHRRLAIIDPNEGAAQPMHSNDGRYTIVFNGEIYNYRELREALVRDGAVMRTNSDTEVLLALWARNGPDCLGALRGMFAFAIWDEQAQRLVAARDPLGIKPFYYADNGRQLLFASQVKALAHARSVDRGQDSAAVVGFFLWGHVPEPHTLYRGIRSLRPGHCMSIDAGGRVSVSRYAPKISEVIGGMVNDGETGGLREALYSSVSHHMVADVPVGAFLSAGIDSAVICTLASESGVTRSLKTITLGFSEYASTSADEVPGAERNARHIGCEHTVRRVEGKAFSESVAGFLKAMDQPTVDGANTYWVSKVAAEAGLKVALSGVGGDELFGGYPSFRQVPRLSNFLRRVPVSAGRAARVCSAPVIGRFFSPKYAGVLEYGSSVVGAYLLRRALFMPWELSGVLDRDLVAEGVGELNTLENMAAAVEGLADKYDAVTALETEWYMQPRLLRDADWAGMAHSLEIRTPLVDSVLFGQVQGVRRAGNGRPNKRDLALAPKRRLPQETIDRPKSGFSIPVDEWMRGVFDSTARGSGLRGWARFIGEVFEMNGLRRA